MPAPFRIVRREMATMLASHYPTHARHGLRQAPVDYWAQSTSTLSGGGHPTRGPRSRDITSQTRTPATLGADGTAGREVPRQLAAEILEVLLLFG